MFLAEVLGTVVSPVQHASLEGQRLLLVRVLQPDGAATGRTRIAIDRARAGPGDRVLIVDEGHAARTALELADAPVKTVVLAVVDYVELASSCTTPAPGRPGSAPVRGCRLSPVESSPGIQSARPSTWSEEHARLRAALCRMGALCYQKGYIVGADGNLSVRTSDGSLLVTPAGAMKGFLEPQHIAHVDLEGRVLDEGPRCSTEVGIHLVSYRERPDMHAVIHTHPPHAVALSIAGIDLSLPIIPEVIVTIGGTPTTPYATPGTDELADSIRAVVRCSDTLIMKNHGAVTLGANLMEAFKKLDMVEHTARILWLAHVVKGTVDPLPPEAVRKLLETRRQLGIGTTNVLENRCG